MNIIPFKGRLTSGAYNLNYLYKTKKTYIMDNHLAAGWCWLQEIDIKKQYNLFHIDRHYDLLDGQVNEWKSTLQSLSFDYVNIDIQELIGIQYKRSDMKSQEAQQLFSWANYITILDSFYPNLWFNRSFATHRDGTIPPGYRDGLHEPRWEELPKNLSYWIGDSKQYKTVLNLDIDYFFFHYNQEYFQVFTDDYIKIIAKEIASAWHRVAVCTIALSPEYCGGWENAIRVARLITDELDIEWDLT